MNSAPKVALCLIVRGVKEEAPFLDACLRSVKGHVDGIYLNLNHAEGKEVAPEVIAIANKHKAKTIITEWTGDFAGARNANFAQVPKTYDWILWLDADDTVKEPALIKKTVSVASKAQQGIYAKYDYLHDEYGNVTVTHYVARLVRNNGSYTWRSSLADRGISVHETLVEVVARPKAFVTDFTVTHNSNQDRQLQSLTRNISLLEQMYEQQVRQKNLDPRTMFYLATHYFDAEDFGGAKELFQEYMQLSGWAEERAEALVYLGKILELEGKADQAHHAYLLSLGEFQNSPKAYLQLSKNDFRNKRFDEAASWVEKALALKPNTTTMVQRPTESTYDAYMLAAQAYMNMGGKKLDDAKKYITKALDVRPLDVDAKRGQEIIDELIEQREDIRAAVRIARTFAGDKAKTIDFLNTLPHRIQDNPLILNTRFAHSEPTVWPKKSIAIYVGQGPLGIWGPWSLASGIGGSEEAVIRLSRELAELGWSVTIFATPGDRAGLDHEYDSKTGNLPEWKQYYEFNPKDEYDNLIVWRNPAFFDADIKANKSYLWLHDLMDKEEMLPDRIAKVEKVIFVGQYHADYYKGIIPEEKWLVSGNGIDPQDFIDADKKHYKRTPHRMIYMSAHNRGLKVLLDNWDKIKKEVPDATLDIYYGWDSYDAINKDNPERMEWKNALVKQINSLDGVTDHGRVDQTQIVKEIATADMFAYPCVFPEVYCISYVKALAGGLYPMTSDYAELKNYQGDQVHFDIEHFDQFQDNYIGSLIQALQGTRLKMNMSKEDVREKYSWKHTAEQWDKEMA